eukprot:6393333-Prymnesium_polylepis.1
MIQLVFLEGACAAAACALWVGKDSNRATSERRQIQDPLDDVHARLRFREEACVRKALQPDQIQARFLVLRPPRGEVQPYRVDGHDVIFA